MDSFFPIDGIEGISSRLSLQVQQPSTHFFVFQATDDRFQTGPSGGQPLEPGALFIRPLDLSLARNGHLRDLFQKVRFPFLLAPVSPVRRQHRHTIVLF
jgi:hypothetical protein